MNTIFSKFRIDLVLHSKNQQNFVFFFFVPSITSNVYTRIEKKKKKKKTRNNQIFPRTFRNLPTSPFHSNISYRDTNMRATSSSQRRSFHVAICSVPNATYPPPPWMEFSRFELLLKELRRCYNRRCTSFYSIMSNIYIYICWVGWNILNYLLFICILIIFFFKVLFSHKFEFIHVWEIEKGILNAYVCIFRNEEEEIRAPRSWPRV